MKNFLSKIKVNNAVKTRNKFDLSFDHYTTNDFFRLKPVMIKELVPGDEFDIELSTLSRTIGALKKPTLTSVEFTNRLFFVPARCVMHGFNEFITDTQFGSVKVSSTPTVSNSLFVQEFLRSDESLAKNVLSTEAYDFVSGTGSSAIYRKFTERGRWIYDILRNLGYHVNFTQVPNDSQSMSALPLLAFMKLYFDWYKNSNWGVTNQDLYKFAGGAAISSSQFHAMIQALNYSILDKDYFTSAWSRPVSPNSSNITGVSFEDYSNDAPSKTTNHTVPSSVTLAQGYTPSTPSLKGGSNVIGDSSKAPANITQYAIDRLKQLTDYVKRYQLVGDRALDRFFALFGIELPDAKLDRSLYLGSSKNMLNIGEVMATADNAETNTAVGDYSGRANSYGNGHFHFKTDEYGFLIMISVVKPHVGYCQGRDRIVHHINRLDFWNPQFEGAGSMQPIRQDELFVDFVTDNQIGTWKSNNVFGWTSYAAEYKQSLDMLSGDLAVRSLNAGLESWHTLRILPEDSKDSTTQYINEEFTLGDPWQYDRIFNYEAGDVDHFVSVYHFRISAYRNMRPMFEDYDFDGGRALDMSIGGTTLE